MQPARSPNSGWPTAHGGRRWGTLRSSNSGRSRTTTTPAAHAAARPWRRRTGALAGSFACNDQSSPVRHASANSTSTSAHPFPSFCTLARRIGAPGRRCARSRRPLSRNISASGTFCAPREAGGGRRAADVRTAEMWPSGGAGNECGRTRSSRARRHVAVRAHRRTSRSHPRGPPREPDSSVRRCGFLIRCGSVLGRSCVQCPRLDGCTLE